MRKSSGEYPANWAEIARDVKERAGWKCVRCNHAHSIPDGFMLTVHHLDMNKSNCAWWNVVALCQRCHLSIQGRVIMERIWIFEHSEWFLPYVGGYYANIFSHDLDAYLFLEAPECHDYYKSLDLMPIAYIAKYVETFIQFGRGLLTVPEVIEQLDQKDGIKCLPTLNPANA